MKWFATVLRIFLHSLERNLSRMDCTDWPCCNGAQVTWSPNDPWASIARCQRWHLVPRRKIDKTWDFSNIWKPWQLGYLGISWYTWYPETKQPVLNGCKWWFHPPFVYRNDLESSNWKNHRSKDISGSRDIHMMVFLWIIAPCFEPSYCPV